MFDPAVLTDSTVTILAQMDVFDAPAQAPEGFSGPVQTLIGMAKWIGFVLVGVGIIVMGASMAVSRREGSSEEATSNAIRIGAAAMLLGGVSSILGVLMGG